MIHLLLNADVYAPQPLGIRHILVCAGSIEAILTERPVLDASLGVEVRDLEGRRLMPGFVDGHAHLTGGGGEAGFSTQVPPLPLSAFTTSGVTTVVGVLGTDDETRSTASLVARINGLREEGLSAYGYTGGYHLPPTTLTGRVRSDIVYIDSLIGMGELAISDHRSSQPTFEEFIRSASEVHVAGLITGKAGVLHLHLGDGPRGLALVRRALVETELPPRVFNPTHVNRRKALFQEACALTPHGCTIDVTAFPVEEGEDAWSASEALALYLDAGFSPNHITISSDGGGCLPVFDRQGELVSMDFATSQSLPETLRAWLEAGRSLEDLLPALTSNVARLLRLHRKGGIAVGMDADLVVLDDEHRVWDVMARGRWHVKDGRVRLQGRFEQQEHNQPSA